MSLQIVAPCTPYHRWTIWCIAAFDAEILVATFPTYDAAVTYARMEFPDSTLTESPTHP